MVYTCEKVRVHSIYVERRMISSIVASAHDPMLKVGGIMEFGFTYWKRVSRVEILGAQGDRPSSNSIGEPDFPSPSNEYFHTYCNANGDVMQMGSSSYSSSIIDQTLITGTYSTEFGLGMGMSDNIHVDVDDTVCSLGPTPDACPHTSPCTLHSVCTAHPVHRVWPRCARASA